MVIAVGAWLALAPGAHAAVTYRDALEQVTRADGYRYTLRDDHGRSMDTLKILRRDEKRYLGVYHSLAGGRFEVHVATSRDLFTWRHRARLAVNASQPAVARRPGGRYLVAYEKDAGCRGGNNCLGFRRYDTHRELLNARPSGNERLIARRFSKCAEGTPNFYRVTRRSFDLGFHYFQDCRADRQARGTYDLATGTWKPRTRPSLDARLLAAGAHRDGNLGDRDATYFPPARTRRGIHEGMVEPRSAGFRSWRCFAEEGGAITQLQVRTHGGSIACANPTVTNATLPDGRRGLIVTYFVPVEGAGRNEAGTLVFWRAYG